MKVLMLGWEFPPYKSGGLGTACHGLTKGLSKLGVGITFVIPKTPIPITSSFLSVINAKVDSDDECYSHLNHIFVDSKLAPYAGEKKVLSNISFSKTPSSKTRDFSAYGANLFFEVECYAKRVLEISKKTDFDLIHAHDWMTYPAAILLKEKTKKKMIVQIHATEFDRTGGHPNQRIYEIEKMGFERSDKIIAVSNYTKSVVCEKYGISPDKVDVVHNAVEINGKKSNGNGSKIKIFPNDKIVLFLGRVTIQKGPEYFLRAAKQVLEFEPYTKFFVAGSGDMLPWMIEEASRMGLSDKVFFTGFLTGDDIDYIYRQADVYVMPSVSEPFGITPLEAMACKTPVIISKQSGVSEVINNCFKVDFWDVNELTNKIVSILRYECLKNELKNHGYYEVTKITWDNSAKTCKAVYEKVI
jgi:glycosyltransferase involved in cell wall biosynthesis